MHLPSARAFLALLSLGSLLSAQAPEPTTGLVALRQACLDAAATGVVLNIAAHPDDESSRTDVVLRRKYGLRVVTAYATYGDGGQNAVGKEIGPDLARLRVRETLRAAAISGVEVRWLGMADFGFSKTLDETLQVWGADKLKEAMRRVVDEVEPDFVITNHSLTQGHGHHRASYWAITEVLKERAAAGRHVPVLYSRCPAEKAQWTVDPAELDPVRGETYARIAHRAWTQHQTQGPWGPHNPLQVGKDHWQVVFPDGVDAAQAKDPVGSFAGAMAGMAERMVARAFQKNGERALQEVGYAELVRDLPAGRRRDCVQQVLLAQRGVAVEAWLDQDEIAAGGTGKVFVVVHGRDQLRDLRIRGGGAEAQPYEASLRGTPFDAMPAPPAGTAPSAVAPGNEQPANGGAKAASPAGPAWRFTLTFPVPPLAPDEGPPGPEPSALVLDVAFALGDAAIELHPRLLYARVPPLEVRWDRDAVLVPKGSTHERLLSATIRRYRAGDLNEAIRLGMGPGVVAEAIPGRIALSDEHPEARVLVRATFDGAELPDGAALRLSVGGAEARLRLVPAGVTVPAGLRVLLVRGPDDTLERALADLGIAYAALDRDALATARLEDFSTLLLDMRAYFHRPELAEHKDRILQFCRGGGRVVAMYHKEGEWNEKAGHPLLAPFPMTIGADRITEEDGTVRLLQPEHRLFTTPHRITAADFTGWVQERGLNFPSKWDPAWMPLLELQDRSDEKPLQGALLHTQFGRGDFVYCSLVLYRQLRAGHVGAARLLVNLLTR